MQVVRFNIHVMGFLGFGSRLGVPYDTKLESKLQGASGCTVRVYRCDEIWWNYEKINSPLIYR